MMKSVNSNLIARDRVRRHLDMGLKQSSLSELQVAAIRARVQGKKNHRLLAAIVSTTYR
jgi:hypothetical protein